MTTPTPTNAEDYGLFATAEAYEDTLKVALAADPGFADRFSEFLFGTSTDDVTEALSAATETSPISAALPTASESGAQRITWLLAALCTYCIREVDEGKITPSPLPDVAAADPVNVEDIPAVDVLDDTAQAEFDAAREQAATATNDGSDMFDEDEWEDAPKVEGEQEMPYEELIPEEL